MDDSLRPDPGSAAPPGSPGAVDGGCLCSVLLNRLVDDRGEQGFVDPSCPLHGVVDDHA